jgi:hypothetical protein
MHAYSIDSMGVLWIWRTGARIPKEGWLFLDLDGGENSCRTEEENQERCIRLCVLIVEKNVKFHSSLMAVDRYIVESAIPSEDH